MFKSAILLLLILFTVPGFLYAQKGYIPKIEPCACVFKADSSLKTRCAYLIVPENRQKQNGKTIRLPFIYVESNNHAKKKDPVLFTGGGPGLSSLHPVTFVHRRSLIKDRDFIAFEQRGTQYALPCLSCDGIGEAIKKAYRNNLPVDSLELEAYKTCREKLIARGIDLSAYNTDESAADIEDLRIALKIDSLNLLGISYSGGLMMAVLKKYPQHIRSLILDSPLPEFINIDEQELTNLNEALNQVFKNCEADSTDKTRYANLKQRFEDHFTAIGDKSFFINYLEKGTTDSLHIRYGRKELLQILHGYIEDYYKIKEIPYFITEAIKGNHLPFVRDYFDGVFRGAGGPSGMRMSVYCSDKMAYASPLAINRQEQLMPYLAGFHVNDVYLQLCNCWQVKPINADTKTPFFSNTPALLGAGGMDDSCRPVYNDMIHQYMPNSQRLLFTNRQHAPLLNTREGDLFIGQFLDNPRITVKSEQKNIIAY